MWVDGGSGDKCGMWGRKFIEKWLWNLQQKLRFWQIDYKKEWSY